MKKCNIKVNISRASRLLVVHQQHVKVGGTANGEDAESRRQHVPCLLVATVTDVGHQDASLKLTADARVNTLGSSPAGLQEETTFRNGIAARHIMKSEDSTRRHVALPYLEGSASVY